MARFTRLSRSQVAQLLHALRSSEARRPKALPHRESSSDSHETKGGSQWRDRLTEGAATAFGSVVVLGLAGFAYHQFYKVLVLRKMEKAFVAGYSTPELTALSRHAKPGSQDNGVDPDVNEDDWISREEQAVIDDIIDGTNAGQYHLITGEKGTGKTSMLLKAMRKIDGDGIAMLEANSDLEIFRLRLGKALNYEFHEDYIGAFFSFRGPRDSTPLLDIERAFNKMEKIALKRQQKHSRPLVLIINRAHLLRDDEDGRNLLEVLQQRAEIWAAGQLVTVVLVSDEYWIEERLRPHATRMRVLPIHDIPKDLAVRSLKEFRSTAFQEEVSDTMLDRIYGKVGGRLRFLAQVAKSDDMDTACNSIIAKEKRWFLNQCWIYGQEMDDEAEEQQDFSAAAMILAKVLVEQEDTMKTNPDAVPGALPEIPLHKARQIMTRGDFIQGHDHINVFSIDSNCMVRADSVAMQNVFREVVAQDGFQDHLDRTVERLDELESLGRTRELTFKELVGNKRINVQVEADGEREKRLVLSVRAAEEDQ